MISDKEKECIDNNYEISKKLYMILKKYRNETFSTENHKYEDFFKNREKREIRIQENSDNTELIELKKETFIKRIVKRILKFIKKG